MTKREDKNMTWFCRRASPRCPAPSSSILFRSRFSIANAYLRYAVHEKTLCWKYYLILLESITEIIYSLSTNSIPSEIQRGECLLEIESESWKKKLMTLLGCVVEHFQGTLLLDHRSEFDLDRVLSAPMKVTTDR